MHHTSIQRDTVKADMPRNTPLISIAMSLYNAEQTLDLTLQSLLAQTCDDFEILMLDDGSTDNTLSIAKSYDDPRIRVLSDGTNRSQSERLNQAVEISRSEYFARMDNDDIAYPQRLEMQLAYLRNDSDIDLVGASAIVFRGDGEVLGKRSMPESHEEICLRPHAGFPIIHPTYMGRTAWFRRYGYRKDAVQCDDQNMLLRAYKNSSFANVPEILLGYREDSISMAKIIPARRNMARYQYRALRDDGRPVRAVGAVAAQLAKGCVDYVATAIGLNYVLLRHRAQPIDADDREAWQTVWQALSERNDV